jgi:hypothetical protein
VQSVLSYDWSSLELQKNPNLVFFDELEVLQRLYGKNILSALLSNLSKKLQKSFQKNRVQFKIWYHTRQYNKEVQQLFEPAGDLPLKKSDYSSILDTLCAS